MLNPRAYRAALLEQLTSAAEVPPQSTYGEPSRYEERNDRGDARDVDRIAPPSSSLRLSRACILANNESTLPSTTLDARAIDDSPLRRRQMPLHSDGSSQQAVAHRFAAHAAQQPEEHLPFLLGHGYLVEGEGHRSLILGFIDNCIRSGVPEDVIAEQVQFMVASMKESLALHEALHAQRHKERIREYELSALANMIERQQLQLDQQQQQLPPSSNQDRHAPVSPLDPLQLLPPPPLVHIPNAAPLDNFDFSNKHPRQDGVPSHPSRESYRYAYPVSTGSVSLPQGAQPPTTGDASLSWAGTRHCGMEESPIARSPVRISTWRQPAQSSSEGSYPSVQLTASQRHTRKTEEGRESENGAMNSRDYSRRPSTRSSSADERIDGRCGSATARAHAAHRHHALCDACLRNAKPPATVEVTSKSTSLIAPVKGNPKNAANTKGSARTSSRQRSSTEHRQRYLPNGHYMKPTHASLIRRTSPTSATQFERTPVASTAPLRTTSPVLQQPGDREAPQRKLLVRSTYSSRLRVAASRPRNASAEISSANDYCADGNGGEDSDESTSDNCDDPSSDGDEGRRRSGSDATVEREAVAEPHAQRKKIYQTRRETGNDKRLTSLDFYAADSHAAWARPRAAGGASTAAGVGSRQTAPSASTSQPSKVWKISIDPEPASSRNASECLGNAELLQGRSGMIDATTLQWQRTPSSPSLCALPSTALSAEPQGQPRHRDAQEGNKKVASQRPRRSPPTPPPLSVGTPTSTSTTANAPQSLVSRPSVPITHSRGAPLAVTSLTAAVVDDDENAVCVTSPELQLFLEMSQRKVRETERVLAGSSGVASVASAAAVRLGPSRISPTHLSPQPWWHQQQQHHSSLQEIVRSANGCSSLSPLQWDARSSLWSDRSLEAAQEKQQRLRELHDRLKAYGTPVKRGHEKSGAAQRLGESTFSSFVASSPAAPQDPQMPVRHPTGSPLATALEHSPLIEISPTSSDEDNGEA
ncbi:hypothetical protein ABL78_3960 [Leptomonas seymouri]|uniref:Uncharacterized protein n=1 Tax=Leptomonas seymouri TaxID=5684 RepID=A0A0N0P5X6_LEPSE|nr:hypothetical protein ABL78_3960 [Leptomonas seymouri]|eukprot:KPI86969.1 hypothetical protein ABL78_3960 [Leptomonas seymouri]